MSKSQLRNQISQALDGLSKVEKDSQSAWIHAELIEHPKFKLAKRIFLYLSTANEVDTLGLVRYTFEREKQCFIPLVLRGNIKSNIRRDKGETRMVMVKLRSFEEYTKLPTNHYGIKEPKWDQLDGLEVARPYSGNSLDLFVVPGVAFSFDGARLGHGKGYYDEFLTRWSSETPRSNFYTIGLGFRQQLVADTFATYPKDFKLDEILVGREEIC